MSGIGHLFRVFPAFFAALFLHACATPSSYMGIDLAAPAATEQSELRSLASRAQAGDKQAQLELGKRFEWASNSPLSIKHHLPCDMKKAKKLYRQAAADSGGTIWVYSPAVGNGTSGRVIPVNSGPKQFGLAEADWRARQLSRNSKTENTGLATLKSSFYSGQSRAPTDIEKPDVEKWTPIARYKIRIEEAFTPNGEKYSKVFPFVCEPHPYSFIDYVHSFQLFERPLPEDVDSLSKELFRNYINERSNTAVFMFLDSKIESSWNAVEAEVWQSFSEFTKSEGSPEDFQKLFDTALFKFSYENNPSFRRSILRNWNFRPHIREIAFLYVWYANRTGIGRSKIPAAIDTLYLGRYESLFSAIKKSQGGYGFSDILRIGPKRSDRLSSPSESERLFILQTGSFLKKYSQSEIDSVIFFRTKQNITLSGYCQFFGAGVLDPDGTL